MYRPLSKIWPSKAEITHLWNGLVDPIRLFFSFSIVMFCRELVYKSSGTRWKCRNSSSAGVNNSNWSAGKPGPWFLDGLAGFAVFWCCLAETLKETTQLPRQLQGCTCVWLVLHLFLQCSRCHTHAQLCHGHWVWGICSGEKKCFPCYTGLCHREYFGDTCCWHWQAARARGFCLVQHFPPLFYPQTIEAERLHRKRSHGKYKNNSCPSCLPFLFPVAFFGFLGRAGLGW